MLTSVQPNDRRLAAAVALGCRWRRGPAFSRVALAVRLVRHLRERVYGSSRPVLLRCRAHLV